MAAWTLPAIIAEWCEILTSVLERRSRKYFFTIIPGMLLGSGRRTVSRWLRAAGVSDDWQDHYFFLQTLGREAKHVAKQLLHVAVLQIAVRHVGEFIKRALDDSPTKRYGPKVQLAEKTRAIHLRVHARVACPDDPRVVSWYLKCAAMFSTRNGHDGTIRTSVPRSGRLRV